MVSVTSLPRGLQVPFDRRPLGLDHDVVRTWGQRPSGSEADANNGICADLEFKRTGLHSKEHAIGLLYEFSDWVRCDPLRVRGSRQERREGK